MKHIPWLLLSIAALCLAGCRDRNDGPRRYREVGAAPMAPMPRITDPGEVSAPALAWDTPEGWSETRGSGMRVASFKISTSAGEGLCTLVALAGEAGGMEANVRRWLGQIDLEPDPSKLKTFLERLPEMATRGPAPAVLVDLSFFIEGGTPETPGMLAAMWTQPGRTVFVKLSGPLGVLESERASFLALVGSLR